MNAPYNVPVVTIFVVIRQHASTKGTNFVGGATAASISAGQQVEISANKQELEALAAVEQQQQAAEMEAEEQLRTAQAKLNELEGRVDQLEKALDNKPALRALPPEVALETAPFGLPSASVRV